jgi:hypothetical protein
LICIPSGRMCGLKRRHTRCVSTYITCQLLNQLYDFHENWYELYVNWRRLQLGTLYISAINNKYEYMAGRGMGLCELLRWERNLWYIMYGPHITYKNRP